MVEKQDPQKSPQREVDPPGVDGTPDEHRADERGGVQHRADERSGVQRKVWMIMGILSLSFVGVAVWVSSKGQSPAEAANTAKPVSAKTVTIATVQMGSLPLVAEYRGELDADVAELAAQGSGRLVDVLVNLGDRFEKGELLAKVDAAETRRLLSEAYAQAESALAAQQRNAAQLETARGEAARGERMLAERITSDQEVVALKSQVSILQAETAAADAQRSAALARVALYREQLAQADLKAPFAGAVAHRYLDPGATVAPGTPVLRLVKSGPLEVNFRASELYVNRLKTGTRLSVSTLSTGKETFSGTLSRVSAEVNRTDRSVSVEGTLDEEHSGLRPGMYATVNVSLGTLEEVLLIPQVALTSKLTPEGTTERGVYSVSAKTAHYHPVIVLAQHKGLAAVEGLQLGQQVVKGGQDLLSDGAPVRIEGTQNP